ncbi:hypothetical protein [Flavobacterium sp. N1994]|uniref:hypothetical protein n=1 Tax=Flavobacterium sp. N1994 TaxID=2986827 RepID=UPI0022222E59|nr:hypothetical protein [Flavobacterium sp. N1994]
MTTLLKIGFCLFFLSQTYEYNFNRKLTYEITDLKNQKKNHLVSYFLNEQDNSYFSTNNTFDNNREDVTLLDQNGIYWKGQIKHEDLTKSEILLKNGTLLPYQNPYKFQVDNYDFEELKDTVLNNRTCKRFMLRNNVIKNEKKKKLGREIYVIDTSANIKPLLTFCTAYEVWKSRKNIPNGLIIEKYFYNFKGEMITKEKLKSSENINIKFKVASE